MDAHWDELFLDDEIECLIHDSSHRFRSSEGFRITGEDIDDIAGGSLFQKGLGRVHVFNGCGGGIIFGEDELAGQCQRSDGVLIDQCRQAAEHWLIVASL